MPLNFYKEFQLDPYKIEINVPSKIINNKNHDASERIVVLTTNITGLTPIVRNRNNGLS